MNIDIMPNDFSLSEVQELYPEYEISEYIDSGGTKDGSETKNVLRERETIMWVRKGNTYGSVGTPR